MTEAKYPDEFSISCTKSGSYLKIGFYKKFDLGRELLGEYIIKDIDALRLSEQITHVLQNPNDYMNKSVEPLE